MKTIYNEGRVVGLSAYEIYVKHFLEDHPDDEPATEREWLASNLAMGDSLLLRLSNVKVPENAKVGIIEIPLPEGSKLCAANTIIANFMFASGAFLTDPISVTSAYGSGSYRWHRNLYDVGQIMSNGQNVPAAGYIDSNYLTSIPPKTIKAIGEAQNIQLKGYVSIYDGVVIQPGTWSQSEPQPDHMDFSPDLTKPPVIRLMYTRDIYNTAILFTGFSHTTVVKGESALDYSMDSSHPEDGDYLGPEAYPWVNRVVFSIPSTLINSFYVDNFQRKIDAETNKSVNQLSIVDMNSSQASEYYADKPDAAIPQTINELNAIPGYTVNGAGDQKIGANVITLYSRRGPAAPSALYQSQVPIPDTYFAANEPIVQQPENVNMYPVDVVSPGTIKLFDGNTADNQAKAKALENNEFENYALIRDGSYIVRQLQADGTVIPVAEVTSTAIDHSVINSGAAKAKKIITKTGTSSGSSLYVPDGSITTPTSNLATDTVYWAALLEGLANNKGLDVLGERGRALKAVLAGLASGQYVLNIDNSGNATFNRYTWGDVLNSATSNTKYIIVKDGNGNITLQPYSEVSYNFGLYTISLTPTAESTAYYTNASKITLFKYAEEGQIIQTFGTLDQTRRLNYDTSKDPPPEIGLHVAGQNWGQVYKVIESEISPLFTQYIHYDGSGQPVVTDCIKIEIVPRPSFHSDSGILGAPSDTEMVAATMYIIFTGATSSADKYRAVIFNLNNKKVEYIPSQSSYQITCTDYFGHTNIWHSNATLSSRSGFTWSDSGGIADPIF